MFNIMIKKTTLFIYCPIVVHVVPFIVQVVPFVVQVVPFVVQVVPFRYIVLKYHILSINNCMVSRQTKVGRGLRAPSSSNPKLHKYAKR